MNLVGLCTARQSAARTYQPVPTYETSSAACSAGWIVFSRPFGTDSAFQTLPRTHVLGYSQAELSKLADWSTLSR